jgi:DNA-binding NarL/FixJ family response regulator
MTVMSATRLLLADDHDLVRAGIRNALQDQENLQIVGEVGNGVALRAALAQLLPDLLIVDVTMPHFEPIGAIREIRQEYPKLRILVVSAHDDDVYVQGLLREGVDGYHLKEQPLNDLRLAVAYVLAGKRWISSPLVDKLVQGERSGIGMVGGGGQLPQLSGRQVEILRLLAEGLDNRALAGQLGVSIKTIETHLTRLYRQINVQSRLEAAHYAHEHPEVVGGGKGGGLGLGGGGTRPWSPPSPSSSSTTPTQPHLSTILIIDDSIRYRQQLRRMVSRLSPQAKLYEASNTEEALALVRQISPQVIFIDVVLGEESGIRCTQRLKAQNKQARIVLMSAYPDREFHRQGLQAGAMAFVDKKELDTETLHQILLDVVG